MSDDVADLFIVFYKVHAFPIGKFSKLSISLALVLASAAGS